METPKPHTPPQDTVKTPEKRPPSRKDVQRIICHTLLDEGQETAPGVFQYRAQIDNHTWDISNQLGSKPAATHQDREDHTEKDAAAARDKLERGESPIAINPAPEEPDQTKSYILFNQNTVAGDSTLTQLVRPGLSSRRTRQLPQYLIMETQIDPSTNHLFYRFPDPVDVPLIATLVNTHVAPSSTPEQSNAA